MALLRAKRALASTERPSLVDFVHEVSPHLEPPRHLEPYAITLESAIGANLRLCFAAPPQHGKTELSLRAFLWWDRYYPGKRHAYVTFNQDRTQSVAKEFIRLAEEAGFQPTGTLREVRLLGGSTIIFTSIYGGLTGSAIDGVCLIDDPIKDGVDARSARIRQDTHDFWRSVARARRHPGTSYIEMATRWHTEDLTGYLVNELGWSYINLKAISEGSVDESGIVIGDPLKRTPGLALWPSYKPVEFFAEERADDYWWASMYQGEPRPDGAQVFKDVQFCDEIPRAALQRVSIGVDFAYTAKTSADFSVATVLAEHAGTYYVLDVLRLQVEPREFRQRLSLLASEYTHPLGAMPTFTAYVAMTEQGGVEFVREADIHIRGLKASADKLTRAIPAAAAWNTGNIKIPVLAPWREKFVREVCGFTGIKDRHDDQVDALAAAFDGLTKTRPIDVEYMASLNAAMPKTQIDWS